MFFWFLFSPFKNFSFVWEAPALVYSAVSIHNSCSLYCNSLYHKVLACIYRVQSSVWRLPNYWQLFKTIGLLTWTRRNPLRACSLVCLLSQTPFTPLPPPPPPGGLFSVHSIPFICTFVIRCPSLFLLTFTAGTFVDKKFIIHIT
jgi:hypothetical protein